MVDALSLEDARGILLQKNLIVEEIQPEQGPPLTFSKPLPWATVEEEPATADETPYIPLSETLRLFAGWLLSWYALIYLLGYYQRSSRLPWEIPFIEGLFVSSLVLRFAFGTFLFLLLGSLHRWMNGGIVKGVLLVIVWIAGMLLFHWNA